MIAFLPPASPEAAQKRLSAGCSAIFLAVKSWVPLAIRREQCPACGRIHVIADHTVTLSPLAKVDVPPPFPECLDCLSIKLGSDLSRFRARRQEMLEGYQVRAG